MMMGYYQLGRLYYCFSNEKINSTKGYPRWLFVIMYSSGIILLVNFALSVTFLHGTEVFREECRINENFQYEFRAIEYFTFEGAEIWWTLVMVLYIVWDVTILILYVNKIKLFNTHNDNNNSVTHTQIRIILHKIFLLTMLYEIVALIGTLCGPLFLIWVDESDALLRFTMFMYSISVSISMYLMMDHNKERYLRYLLIIRSLKLHWICCKWRYIVNEQITQLNKTNNLRSGERLPNMKEVVTNTNTTDTESGANTKSPAQDVCHQDQMDLIKEVPKWQTTRTTIGVSAFTETTTNHATMLDSETHYIPKYDGIDSEKHINDNSGQMMDNDRSNNDENSDNCIVQ